MNSQADTFRRWRRWCLAVGLWGPLGFLLIGSYLLLAVHHRNWNLFPVVVHENGKYTLTETIFYFRHFVREILPTGLIVLGSVAAWRLNPLAPKLTSPQGGRFARVGRWLGLALLLFLVVTCGIAVQQQGWRETLLDLAQYRTRDDRAEFGTHWQYHLLHVLDAFLFSLAVAWIVRGFSGRGTVGVNRGGAQLGYAWAGLFALLTVGFSPNLRPFNDPLYLAHQLREIATSRLLLIPTVFGLLQALELWTRKESAGAACQPRLVWSGVAMLGVATLIPLWLWWRLRDINVLSLAQQQTSLATLFAAHNFEHCLDVIFALLLAGWCYLRSFRREASSPSAP